MIIGCIWSFLLEIRNMTKNQQKSIMPLGNIWSQIFLMMMMNLLSQLSFAKHLSF